MSRKSVLTRKKKTEGFKHSIVGTGTWSKRAIQQLDPDLFFTATHSMHLQLLHRNLPTLLPWYALDGLHRANAITQRARVIIGFALWPVCATFLLKIGGGESVDLAQSSRCLRMRRGGRCTGVRRHGRATFARHCTGFRVSGPFYRESRGAFGVHPRLKRSFFT